MRRSSRIVQLLHSAAGRAAPAATAAGGPAPAAAAAAAALRSASSSSAAAGSAAAATSRASWQRLALATGLCVGAAGAGLLAIGGGTADCDAPAPEGDAPDGAVPALARRKTRIVVLGSGWGAMSFLKSLDPKSFGPDGKYELVVVSPRSYFLYTPLLPSAAAGTVSTQSIMEPIRNMLHGQGEFFQAEAVAIDPHARTITCRVDPCAVCKTLEHEHESQCKGGAKGGKGAGAKGSAACAHSGARDTFEIPYDVLLLGVGSVNNTFGIPGVREHCFFMKSVDDAQRLRSRISRVIEHAGLPHLTPEERRRHLSFVVVGGGPTGVELAAELHDFVQEDVSRLLPHLKDEVRISVVDTMDHLLGAFDRQLSEYTREHFGRGGIDVQLGTMVRKVEDGALTVTRNGGGGEDTVPFGTCVWATGIAMHPLVAQLKSSLQSTLSDVQNARTGLVVDSHLRVKGTRGTIFCLGDAAVTHQDKALANAAQLFAAADRDGDQRLSRAEVCAMLKKVKRQFPQMGELAAMLEEGALEKAAKGVWGASTKPGRYSTHIERLQKGLTYEEFQDLLRDMDTLMRSLPPTAQVASQEGKFLAKLFSSSNLAPYPAPTADPAADIALPTWVPLPEGAAPFEYRHAGSFAYVGADEAILSLPSTFPFSALKGWLVGLSWRSFETWGQVSLRNRLMVQGDWLKTKIFGRNITEA